ncbi:hypothetical protein [Microbacterium istanbulense]|uniref:Uncharacterized protein n=1 Tax=Microbacterium istanbulense TaxID=3122049 RepID=A0ABU8LN66_9MICO
MSERGKNLLWFLLPALVGVIALAAISLPTLNDAASETSPTEAIIALLLFAVVGGAIIGGAVYAIRKLSTRRRARR